MKALLLVAVLWLTACQAVPVDGIAVQLGELKHPATQTTQLWPITAPLSAPNGLRPCCAFGYNLRAEMLGIPVPLYQLNNVVAPEDTGQHHYNNSLLYTLASLSGLNSEHDGLVYTRRGGFIDLAHLRDTADNTLWLFSQIWSHLGEARTLVMDEELGQRRIQLQDFTPPDSPVARYNLSVILAAHLAYELAAWHEISQWYGFESVPGFSEGVSAFSPEDLYSNLLGARIVIDLLNTGAGSSLSNYQRAMESAIPQALAQLQAEPPSGTRFHFDMLDKLWWNSYCRLPEKFLLRHRNYSVSDQRRPSRPWESVAPLWLTLPDHFQGIPLAHYGRLEIGPGKSMVRLPVPQLVYHFADFEGLAQQAKAADQRILAQLKYRCD